MTSTTSPQPSPSEPHHSTWERRDSGPAAARQTVLLLPGGMCNALSYDDLMAEPALAGLHLVAVTLPGNGGTPAPADMSVENYAQLTGVLAEELRCDVVVGFSMGANVAIEMVASGAFRGPVILLAPCFSRQDEAVFLRALDRLARVFGHLPFSALVKMVGLAAKDSPLPRERLDPLIRELRRNDPRDARRAVHAYLRHLDHYGSVAPRLRDAGVRAWVVHGERGDGAVTDDERATLETNPSITMVTIPGASFFMPNEQPGLVAELIVDALDSLEAAPERSPQRPEARPR